MDKTLVLPESVAKDAAKSLLDIIAAGKKGPDNASEQLAMITVIICIAADMSQEQASQNIHLMTQALLLSGVDWVDKRLPYTYKEMLEEYLVYLHSKEIKECWPEYHRLFTSLETQSRENKDASAAAKS